MCAVYVWCPAKHISFQEKGPLYRLSHSVSARTADHAGSSGKAAAEGFAGQGGGQSVLHHRLCEVAAGEQRKEDQGVHSR